MVAEHQSRHWAGQISVVVLVLAVLLKLSVNDGGRYTEAAFYIGLSLSSVLAIIATVRQTKGWKFLIPPTLVWASIGILLGLWMLSMR